MSANYFLKTAILGCMVAGFAIGCDANAENKDKASGDNLAANESVKTATVNNAEPATATAASKVYTIESVNAAGGDKMTDFSWMQDGKKVSLSEVAKGKVVFLNFWATWCPPCRKEIPDIIELSKELPASDFVVVGVSLDNGANAASLVGKFAESKGMSYLNLLGNAKLTEAYGGVSSIPTTFIIDKSGNIAERIVGSQSKQEFLASISKHLELKK